MPIYIYKGYDSKTGATRKGKVEAESQKAARSRLKQKMGILVSDLKEQTSREKAKLRPSIFGGSKVKLGDVAVMTRQFATLQQAHVPLDESLKALQDQVENRVLQVAMAEVKDSVSEGKALAEAMKPYPGIFDRLYVNMVKAGESSGTLGVVLTRLADFLEYQIQVRGQIFAAMTYPAMMIFASLGIIAYLFISVVPQLQKVFKSLKVKLPWYTEVMIAISETLQKYWWLIIIIVFLAAAWFRSWVTSPKGKEKFDQFVLKLPLFGGLLLRMNVSAFTRTLATLLSSGVPIINALEITKNTVNNSVIAGVLDLAKTAVQEGQSLGAVIEKSGRFPPLVVHMILTGERTGELETMLGHVSAAYDSEAQRKISSMISLIEPLMIIVMAGISICVVVAMLVPMLSIMSSLR